MTSGNLTADIIQGILQFVGKLLVDAIIKLKNQSDIKTELALSMEASLNETQKSFDEFLFAYFVTYGAIVNARTIRFSNPDKKADEIVSKLEQKYKIFLRNFIGLMRLVDVHKMSLKEVMGKDWVIMEVYLGAFNSKEPDWNFLVSNPLIQENIKIQDNDEFYSELNLKLNLFSKKIDAPKFIENLKDFSAVYSSKSFFNCLLKCIMKRVKLLKIRRG